MPFYRLLPALQVSPFLFRPRFARPPSPREKVCGCAAKILYTVLLARALISARSPDWQDDRGRVFLYYSVAELARVLHRHESNIKTALTALEAEGLIYRKDRGQGKRKQIYVMVMQSENALPNGPKTVCHSDRNRYPTQSENGTHNNKKEYKRNIYNNSSLSYDSEIDWTGGYDCL